MTSTKGGSRRKAQDDIDVVFCSSLVNTLIAGIFMTRAGTGEMLETNNCTGMDPDCEKGHACTSLLSCQCISAHVIMLPIHYTYIVKLGLISCMIAWVHPPKSHINTVYPLLFSASFHLAVAITKDGTTTVGHLPRNTS